MTEKGAETGKDGQSDLRALLSKIEDAERLLGEIREDLRSAVTERGGDLQPGGDAADLAGAAEVPEGATPAINPPPQVSAESHRAPIEGLFRLAISPPEDADDLEAALGALLHPSAKLAPRAIKMMVRFPWSRFRKSFRQYLTNPAQSDSFVIERKSPPDISSALQAKVFLSVPGKHPAPVELARDEVGQSAWGIVSFSL
jgi:hypothetical protein